MKLIRAPWLPIIGCCGLLLINCAPSHARETSQLSRSEIAALEQGILVEMNRARANPVGYAKFLKTWRRRFQGKQARLSSRLFLQTREGVAVVDEAIRAVRLAQPAPPLRLSAGITRAARDHVKYQGKKGLMGHRGQGGSNPYQRINRQGRYLGAAGENNSYGPDTAVAVVRDLVVDDGVPDRNHRINIFRADYKVAGIACGYHKIHRTMCVIKYATGFRERR